MDPYTAPSLITSVRGLVGHPVRVPACDAQVEPDPFTTSFNLWDHQSGQSIVVELAVLG